MTILPPVLNGPLVGSPVQTRLEELVRIDSTSHVSNVSMIEKLEATLQGLGFSTERQRAPQDVVKENLIALAGPEAAPGLALVGHTDTVPFDPAWANALDPVVREGRLFARGACDTKGFIAAALEAASRTDLTRLRKPLALVFTYDEEVGCIGAKQLLDEERVHPELAIVGEPTSLRPIFANKGYCIARARTIGKEGHSAYPESGVNAIFHQARLLREIERIAAELHDERNDDFDPPFTTLNVGVVSGGKAKNIIAGECEITIEWRPLPGQDPHLVYERIADAAEALHREDPRFQLELEETRVGAGFSTPRDHVLVQFIAAEAQTKPDTVAFGTEGPEMEGLGASAVVFGPGNIQVAHQTGEYVPLNELERCADVLTSSIERFCFSTS